MKLNTKVLSLGLALFINTGFIAACSQSPNTVPQQNSTGSNTTVDTSTSTTLSSSDVAEVQSNYQDDEMTVQDSEDIANAQSGFNTKALTSVGSVATSVNANTTATAKVNIISNTDRDKILKDREKVIKDRIATLKDKLNLYKDLAKDTMDHLRRKEVIVKTSDVVTITNDDGTTSKILDIKFQDKNDVNVFRENKIIKTFATDGTLLKIEHFINVNKQNYTRTYSRVNNINADGSRQVLISSTENWTDGRSRVVSEQRSFNADGSGVGTGTVTVTDKNGNSKTYNININISVAGTVVINPIPVSPQPTATPLASASPAA